MDSIIAVVWWFFTIPKRYDVERRNSPAYKKKKSIVKTIWIASGILIIFLLQYPILAGLAVAAAAVTTFLCLMILDETE